MDRKFDIQDRAKKFVVNIVQMTRILPKENASFVFAKQIIRSASSIGANIVEGGGGVSKKDFINFMSIARKSALETRYWLELINSAELASPEKLTLLFREIEELIKILTCIVLNAKSNKG